LTESRREEHIRKSSRGYGGPFQSSMVAQGSEHTRLFTILVGGLDEKRKMEEKENKRGVDLGVGRILS